MTPDSAGPLRPRVLVADDERIIADSLQAILENYGFEVTTAYSGSSAVEKARCWRPDVFLSDVLMPSMNGVEAAMHIAEALPKCKVLLLSGAGISFDMIAAAKQQGLRFEFLAKPVHPSSLLHVLQGLAN